MHSHLTHTTSSFRSSHHVRLRRLIPGLLVLFASSTAMAQDGQGSSFAEAFFISHGVDADGGRHIELLGSLVIWILLVGSVVSIGLIGQLTSANRRDRIMPEPLANKAAGFLKDGRFRETLTLLKDDESDFAKILHSALSRASGGFSAMQRGLEMAAGGVVAARGRRGEILIVFGQVSPMLGLFGTVYGMILAFQSIVTSGGNADPVLLAGGIGTALVTTFWGLVVAIPALSGYATVRGRLDAAQAEAINQASTIIEEFRNDSNKRPRTATPRKKSDSPNVPTEE